MEFDWVIGCRLGWVVGPKFLLCDGLGHSFAGLGWVEESGSTDNYSEWEYPEVLVPGESLSRIIEYNKWKKD